MECTTVGGYKITKFKKIAHPESRVPLRPFMYQGRIKDPRLENEVQIIRWDGSGKCANQIREDCNIDIFKFDHYVLQAEKDFAKLVEIRSYNQALKDLAKICGNSMVSKKMITSLSKSK